MTVNATPAYFAAEEKYREAKTVPEKIAALEEMLSAMPKHKASETLKKELKAKLSKLKESLQKKSATAFRGTVPTIKREGAGQVFIIGSPNSGKSSLLANLTKATPEIGEYAFTTQTLIPGMMKFEDVQVQLVDTPAISPEHTQTWLSSLLRNADGIVIVLDLGSDQILEDSEEVFKYLAQCKIRFAPASPAQPEPGWVSIPGFLVGNKSDLDDDGVRRQILSETLGPGASIIPVSLLDENSLAALPVKIFRLLDKIRVYCKAPGKPADFSSPTVLKSGSTALDFSETIHKDLLEKFKFARLWRKGQAGGEKSEGPTPDGIRIARDYELKDGDVVEIHT
ncbi:MAG: 50S ribosome-binding GTPase [bacterium]|nr:50S ribosome-binding GTPase [bacterium]